VTSRFGINGTMKEEVQGYDDKKNIFIVLRGKGMWTIVQR